MIEYELSSDAENDVIGIYLYTLENFGPDKADIYTTGLEDRFKLLASNPKLGRQYNEVILGTYRIGYESHSIYYRLSETGIFILRILHQRMDPGRHLL